MNPDPTLQNDLLNYLGRLGSDEQARVVDYARTLASSSKSQEVGARGKDLLRIVGLIPPEDLAEMKRAIEEDCERIDPNEW
jgi:hypothetical protein